MRLDSKFLTLFVVLAGLLASCSSSDSQLDVRQFHLREVEPANREAQMIRGEQMYRLRGAVSMEERQARLGHYYTVNWTHDQAGEVQVVLEYQQAGTASEVHRITREFPSGQGSGKVEFRVVGEDYLKGGRVLAWRVKLLSNGKVIASKQSYLWK